MLRSQKMLFIPPWSSWSPAEPKSGRSGPYKMWHCRHAQGLPRLIPWDRVISMGFPEVRIGNRNSWILFLGATASLGALPPSLCPIIAVKD